MPPRITAPYRATVSERSWARTLAGTSAFVIGVLDIVRAVHPAFARTRLAGITDVLPGGAVAIAGAASLIVGVLLVMLAHGLRRGKARAWRLIMVLLPVSAVAGVLHGGHPLTVALTLGLFVVLLAARSEFRALSDPRTRWRALWVFLAMATVAVAVGYLMVSAYAVAAPPADRLAQVLLGLAGLPGPVTFIGPRADDLVTYSLAGLGALTAVTTLYLVLRPERPIAALTPDEERAVRCLLDREGARDSLGYFALRRDKSVIFSPTGKAAIAYRVVGGVMLASGDPIGDVEAWPGAIREFTAKAGRHAWVPAVIGCSEEGGTIWSRETGLRALEMGDEAVVEVAGFHLEGRAMRNVRQMVHRTERAGYTCEVRWAADIGAPEWEHLRHAARAWRGTARERGFSMALGRMGDPADSGCVLATARGPDGEAEDGSRPAAMLHFVPWGAHGLSLDLMRRERGGAPGLNELLIVKVLQAAPALGVSAVSLNFAIFRSALARGERLGAGPIRRAWRAVLIFLSRWLQIESLYRFNSKFQPRWEPRFLIYPATRDLPRIGLAALRAEAFIGGPRLRPGGRGRR
ncbi:phosphatidylglycerol lysyltransferase domain-containing protein [Spongiactinospora sp. TRM90649]|uniref:phosphatidylglycerol lysyltransferase domain-containing protein n=1 Tax=Spongiactinospora sp. TRM90649 TaxID=3031114 RepID=UPI0023F7DF38|nr:phosphatidylglycerol lysyltransferase domain-containing protein [Spongiactinospora sp. TRM90649]MDF5754286.1 phosphatidylglycerol lysyltransferase domain-containing protein [Spongiactinospora sp. TRM90649]